MHNLFLFVRQQWLIPFFFLVKSSWCSYNQVELPNHDDNLQTSHSSARKRSDWKWSEFFLGQLELQLKFPHEKVIDDVVGKVIKLILDLHGFEFNLHLLLSSRCIVSRNHSFHLCFFEPDFAICADVGWVFENAVHEGWKSVFMYLSICRCVLRFVYFDWIASLRAVV